MAELILPVLRGGLKGTIPLLRKLKGAEVGYVYLEGSKICDLFFPPGDYDEIYVVDSCSVTGCSLLFAKEKLKEIFPKAHVLTVASPKTKISERFIDVEAEYLKPDPSSKIVFVSGYPGGGKTSFAKGLAEAMGASLLKHGKLIERVFDVGKYGEKLAEIEKKHPYAAVRVLKKLAEMSFEGDIVVDGVKSPEQYQIYTFSLLKEPFPFFTEVSEDLRKTVVAVRGMKDDLFDAERSKMLRDLGLEKLANLSLHVPLDAISYGEVPEDSRECLEFLTKNSERKVSLQILGRFNPFVLKSILLRSYERIVMKIEPPPWIFSKAEEVLKEVGYAHTGYAKRLEKKGFFVSKDLFLFLKYTATGFRLIDDILDEHKIRYMSETDETVTSFWHRAGILRATTYAIVLTLAAKKIYPGPFSKWFPQIVNAVMVELELEETGRKPTKEDVFRALAREGAYRAMIYEILGKDWRKGYLEGMLAQAKDDVHGRRKGGREDTERRLNRPLASKEILEELEEKMHTSANS